MSLIRLRAPAYPIRAAYRRVVGLRLTAIPFSLYILDVTTTHMDSGPMPSNVSVYSLKEAPCKP